MVAIIVITASPGRHDDSVKCKPAGRKGKVRSYCLTGIIVSNQSGIRDQFVRSSIGNNAVEYFSMLDECRNGKVVPKKRRANLKLIPPHNDSLVVEGS